MARSRTRPLSVVAAPAPAAAVPTRSVRCDQRLDIIRRELADTVERSGCQIYEFSEKLKAAPVSALQFSSNLFQTAANDHVAREVLAWIEGVMNHSDDYETPTSEQVLREVARLLRQEVILRARHPSRSTSSQSNEVDLCLNSARADLLDRLERFFERLEV